LITIIALLAAGASFAAQAANRPNIVLIVADDLGRADVGFMGGKEIQTPQLDRLARSGAVLNAFYVQPVCSPTRAAIMTGRYPVRTGVYTVVRPHAKWGLPLEERTLAQALREAGYETAICGKWHLGEYELEYRPTRRGFEHQYGHWFGALDYFTHMRDGVLDWRRNDETCDDEGYSTHLLAKEAVARIRQRQKEKPLFLYVPFNAVHSPHQVPDEYTAPYSNLNGVRRTYAGMLAAMDEAVGQISAALDAEGLRENTLVIFSSDNGGPAPGTVTDNGPLRAGKGTIYEGGVRVCAFAAWPGRITAGETIEEPMHAVDLYPTLLKLAGASLEQKLPLDGLDVWPVLTEGKPSPHDAILLCWNNPNRAAVRMENWKLLVNAAGDGAAAPAAKKKAKKQQPPRPSAAIELYDLANDVGEEHNLAADHPAKVAQLRARLDEWLKTAVPPGER
jgi:arylsulfatase A-like enzyme